MLNFFYRSVAKSEMNLLAIKNRIDIYLKKGNERNVLAKRNIIASFGIKIMKNDMFSSQKMVIGLYIAKVYLYLPE